MLSFVWLITNDYKKLHSFAKKGFKLCPTFEEIRELILSGESFNVVATYPPPREFESFFIVKDADRELFTSQEKNVIELYPEFEKELLERKYGVRLFKPNLNLSKVKGLPKLKEFVKTISHFQFGSPFFPKSVFLVGVPGTGKSFSMKAVAGELGYYIAEISLVELLEKPNPVERFEKILRFLEEKEIETVLWVDEVEKVFNSPNFGELMQKLLTVLQEWNETSYFVKGFWWWTANDLKLLKERYPEFLRSERHDYLWFVDFPKIPDSKEIAELYAEFYFLSPNSQLKLNALKYERVYSQAKERFRQIVNSFVDFAVSRTTDYQSEGLIDSDRIPYTPAEIKSFMKLAGRISFVEGKLFTDWEKIKEELNPVIDFSREKILYLRSQREIFKPLN